MNNTKWRKLFLTILRNSATVKQCEIVEFVFKDRVYWVNNMKLTIDINAINDHICEDFISAHLAGGHDPIAYREIDYIEFRKYYNKEVLRPSPPHNKYDIIKTEQDLGEIKRIISEIGQFYWEETDESLRILGYS